MGRISAIEKELLEKNISRVVFNDVKQIDITKTVTWLFLTLLPPHKKKQPTTIQE